MDIFTRLEHRTRLFEFLEFFQKGRFPFFYFLKIFKKPPQTPFFYPGRRRMLFTIGQGRYTNILQGVYVVGYIRRQGIQGRDIYYIIYIIIYINNIIYIIYTIPIYTNCICTLLAIQKKIYTFLPHLKQQKPFSFYSGRKRAFRAVF